MEEIYEIRSYIEILANDIKIYTINAICICLGLHHRFLN